MWSPVHSMSSVCGHLCIPWSVCVVTCAFHAQCVWSPAQSMPSVCGHLCILCSEHVVTCEFHAQCVWPPVHFMVCVCGHLCISCSVYTHFWAFCAMLQCSSDWGGREGISVPAITERQGFPSVPNPTISSSQILFKQPQKTVQVRTPRQVQPIHFLTGQSDFFLNEVNNVITRKSCAHSSYWKNEWPKNLVNGTWKSKNGCHFRGLICNKIIF